MKRLIVSILCVALLMSLTVLPTYANSAQSKWEGVDSTGAITPDQESPIIVEKELLTFDIQEFPQSYYATEDEFSAYTPKVTAEYTFYNPSEYTVTATLLFPFGNAPMYADIYRDASDQYQLFNDTEKFDVTVNGQPVEKKIRHTLSYMYDQFELEQDLTLIVDGFVEDDFYSQELTVTKYTFRINGVETDKYHAADLAMDVPEGTADYRIYFPDQNGCHTQDDGDMRIQTGVEKNGRQFDLYVFGTPFVTVPEWKAYQDGSVEDNEVIAGNAELVSTETTTFLEFALSNREEQSPVSESDWYNAVVAELANSRKSTPNHPVVYCESLGYNFDHNLMRWYEYEITLAPGERIVNTVTAPIYPGIDLGYEPDIYQYTYLLSPAKTWKSFGELEIVINTPYFVTDSTLKGFTKTETGYSLKLDGLPDEELKFTLSTGETPKKTANPYNVIWWLIILVIAGAILLLAGIVVAIVFIIRAVIRKRKKKGVGENEKQQ